VGGKLEDYLFPEFLDYLYKPSFGTSPWQRTLASILTALPYFYLTVTAGGFTLGDILKYELNPDQKSKCV
jgi:hypothetical protein